KGEVWTVRVYGVAGGRESEPGTAQVEIGNTAPTLRYARLSRYDVWNDETITASAGGAFDLDGDPLTASYQWSVNGSVVGDSSSTIDASALEPGDTVSVTITVSDDDAAESAAVSAGPATISAIGGWRQLEPDRGFNVVVPLFFADLDRERYLYLVGGDLWEYRSQGTRSIPWAKLNLTGLPRLFGSSVIYDAARQRFLIWGGVDFSSAPSTPNAKLYELVVAQPGEETFREITTAGQPPPSRLGHVTIQDPLRPRAIILGGGTPDPSPIMYSVYHDDVWELDFSGSDAAWTRLTDNATTAPSILTAATVDPETATAYLFGGFGADGSPLSGVYAFSFESDTFGSDTLTQLGTLQVARGGIGAVDLGDGGALLLDGSPTLIAMGTIDRVERFDYTGGTSTTVTLVGDRPSPQPGVALQRRGQTIHWGPNVFAAELFHSTIDTGTLAITSTLRPHVDTPGATALATPIGTGGAGSAAGFAFGLARVEFGSTPTGTAWTYDGSRWNRDEARSDDDHPRFGASGIAEPTRAPRSIFGGYSARSPGVPAPDVITFDGIDSWTTAEAADSSIESEMRDRPVPAWQCSGFRAVLDGTTYALSGSGATPLTAGSNPPPIFDGASYDVLQPLGGVPTVVAFGGSMSSSFWTIAPCAQTDDWSEQAIIGGPGARFLAQATKVIAFNATDTDTILLFGGASDVSEAADRYGDTWVVTMDAAGVITATPAALGGRATPTPRGSGMLAWDALRQRAVLYGGDRVADSSFNSGSPRIPLADTWEYRFPEVL
ncbi:MAG: hypothetical protein KC668_18440, partial [Myxococcales bacterium]|nr:hypothetical protein [Myxococcales bacterium]